MAFQTKANPSKKQKTAMEIKGKKSFDNSRDDSGNGQMVKSPGGKSPKGKQSLGDRKFSLQVPGKNTPGKNKSDSFSGKKQLTSGNKGKTALKAFQGMKTNGKRKAQDSDDDDKDEEHDELDDDDDDEEEEEINIKTGAQNKTKTPVKTEKTSQASEKMPPKGGKNMKSEPQNISIDVMKSVKLTLDQRREKYSKMLRIKPLPLDVEEAELKALSSDILDVILSNSTSNPRHALLVFANVTKAEENFKILQKTKIRNSDFSLDFCGEKSQKPGKFTTSSPEEMVKMLNIRKLFITNLPMDTSINQVAYLFPQACHIWMSKSTNFRTAKVLFDTAEMAAEAVQANQDAEISGKKICIVYCFRENIDVMKSFKLTLDQRLDVMKSFKLTWDQSRKRRSRSLCMENLPLDVEKAELKALSSDILDVILPFAKGPLKKRRTMHAFLLFANESKVEENFKILQKQKVRNSDFILNFRYEKRQKRVEFAAGSPEEIAEIWNIQQLNITDLPMDTTINQVAYLFPKACHIWMRISTDFRTAKVLFDTAEMAAKAVQANQDAEISGQKISIEYSRREKK